MHWHALICIDNTTNLVELTCIDTKSSGVIAKIYEITWLVCYLRLPQVVDSNGGKFRVTTLPTLSMFWEWRMFPPLVNPHSNVIFKCIHQKMTIVLKTLLSSCPPYTPHDILHLIIDGLATTMCLMQIYYLNGTIKASLGTLAFSCDMLLNIPLILECQTTTSIRETLVNDALLKSYQWCINHDYFVGQWSSSITTLYQSETCHQNLWPLWDCTCSCKRYCHYPITSWHGWTNTHLLYHPILEPFGITEGSVKVAVSVMPIKCIT